MTRLPRLPRLPRLRSSFRWAPVLAALGLAACDDPEPRPQTHVIEERREVPAREVELDVSSVDRFGYKLRPQAESSPVAKTATDLLEWTVPECWKELAPVQFRDLNFALEGGGEAYLTFLSGGGGGTRANLDRWRGEFGQEELTDAEFESAPTSPLLGRPAARLDLEGEMKPMGSAAAKPDWAMSGLFAEFPQFAFSAKLTGPRDVVARERERFLDFCETLRFKGVSTPVATPPESPPGDVFDPRRITYVVPGGWTVGQGSSMRLVTLVIPGGAECWVIPLPGSAGGLESNLNRWRGELGLANLTASEIAALPTIEVLGVATPVLDMTGRYTGMGGPAGLENARVLVAGCPHPASFVSIKMVGPPDVVAREKGAFEAFCRSLEVPQ
jgi:hypothetical protein